MAGYGIAQKKSEKPPVQHRPKLSLCGICGSETDAGKLFCNSCASDIHDAAVREAKEAANQ